MKKQHRIALVCAGPVSRSGLSRLPGIRDHIVWVKSSSLSAASRAANVLGGRAVRDYRELEGAGIILIRAPDAVVADVVDDLVSAPLDWHGRTVLLFEGGLDSAALAPLVAAGARAASLNVLESIPPALLLEGSRDARRRIRHLLAGGYHSAIELNPGGKAEYLTGVRCCTADFMPVIAEAVDRFRRAGMEKAAAEKTAACLFESSLRAYLRAGKRLLQSTRLQASLQA